MARKEFTLLERVFGRSASWKSVRLPTGRIETLSDGVFAIVLTLLVLDLRVQPNIGSSAMGSQEFVTRFMGLWPKFLSYAMSFMVVGVYWVAHHALFNYIKRSDRNFIWLNNLFLMVVSLIPFTASLLGDYGQFQLPVVLYGTHLIVCTLLLYLAWGYAMHNRRLVDPDLAEDVIVLARYRFVITPLFCMAGIAVSYFNTRLSLICYVALILLYIMPDRSRGRFSDISERPIRGNQPVSDGNPEP